MSDLRNKLFADNKSDIVNAALIALRQGYDLNGMFVILIVLNDGFWRHFADEYLPEDEVRCARERYNLPLLICAVPREWADPLVEIQPTFRELYTPPPPGMAHVAVLADSGATVYGASVTDIPFSGESQVFRS